MDLCYLQPVAALNKETGELKLRWTGLKLPIEPGITREAFELFHQSAVQGLDTWLEANCPPDKFDVSFKRKVFLQDGRDAENTESVWAMIEGQRCDLLDDEPALPAAFQ